MVSINAPSIGKPKYVRQILTELIGKMNANTIIVEIVSTLLSIMSGSYRDSIRKKTDLHTINNGPNRHIQNLPSKSIIPFLLKCTQNSFSNHILAHKTRVNKCKKIEII